MAAISERWGKVAKAVQNIQTTPNNMLPGFLQHFEYMQFHVLKV